MKLKMEIQLRILLRERFFRKIYGDTIGRIRKKAARIEMVYAKAQKEVVWITINGKMAALTVVEMENLMNQSPERKTIQMYDTLSGEIMTIQADCMPEYLSLEARNQKSEVRS